jgi:hypothetical protein
MTAPEGWTPKAVETALLEAVKWAMRTGGRVGPTGFRSGLPQMIMTQFDRLSEQWPAVQELEARPMRVQLSPAQISRMERVLEWQLRYLGDKPQSAAALSLWLFCKTRKGFSFSDAIKDKSLSRATIYRKRDMAVMFIALGLERDGIGTDNA